MRPKRRQVLLAAAGLVILLLLLAEFRVVVVHGESMLPTYHDGQTVMVNQLSIFGGRWKRGDVVLVRLNNEVLIKRIFRLPGETLSLAESRRFQGVKEFFEPTDKKDAPFRVPPGYVVVLGDNAAVSDDSRSFGPVKLSAVLGSVINAPSLK
jgi:signal peptidase I